MLRLSNMCGHIHGTDFEDILKKYHPTVAEYFDKEQER